MNSATHTSRQDSLATSLVRDWWQTATYVPGKALHLALGLWLLMRENRTPTVRMTRRMMARVNISRYAASDALRRLEAAGLVKVWRLPGRSPWVTPVEPGTGTPLDLNILM